MRRDALIRGLQFQAFAASRQGSVRIDFAIRVTGGAHVAGMLELVLAPAALRFHSFLPTEKGHRAGGLVGCRIHTAFLSEHGNHDSEQMTASPTLTWINTVQGTALRMVDLK